MSSGRPETTSISVIVPTYNRARYLGECLDSLLAQTSPALEILVVDDGSSDGTRELVTAYGTAVRYLHQENAGKSAAVNRGLAVARGEWVWVLDDDDVALPHANARRLESLSGAPGAGFVFGPHYLASDGPDGRSVRGRLIEPTRPDPSRFFLELAQSCFFHLGTCLVRRSLYQSLQGMDPSLHRGQDYDFQIRLARIAQPVYCPEPAFLFRQHHGVRGPGVMSHESKQRDAVFLMYSQRIGLKLRTSVPLGEYLAPPQPDPDSEPQARAMALLHRMQVMGNHGCVNELLQDLGALLELRANGGQPLLPTDREAIGCALQAGWAYDAGTLNWPVFMAHVRQLKRQPGARQALLSMGLGWLHLAWGHPDTSQRRVAKALHALRLATA